MQGNLPGLSNAPAFPQIGAARQFFSLSRRGAARLKNCRKPARGAARRGASTNFTLNEMSQVKIKANYNIWYKFMQLLS